MLLLSAGQDDMDELSRIDHALDEVLVKLGTIVLRLADVTERPDERRALVLSVHRYAACAARSTDPRVQDLKQQLDATLKPRLRVVAGD